MQKVLFLTTAHLSKDDRIFFHQAKSLAENGFAVKITSLCENLIETNDKIEIESYNILQKTSSEKIETFLKICRSFQPKIIICSEPLAVFSATQFKKEKKVSVIYDITEWYPAMSMLRDYSYPSKIFHAIKFFMINFYAGFLSTHFIFGEETKKIPLAYFFPFKKTLILPYYPDQKFVSTHLKELIPNEITLCCTGQISEEKGIGNFFKAIDLLSKKNPALDIKILIIGSTRTDEDKIWFDNLLSTYNFKNLEIKKPTSFENFTESFSEADLCFDLRQLNFENHHSLPIKLFYYIGAGKPIIYSGLKAISKHMKISDFGHLVNPEKTEKIAEIIKNYIQNPEKYKIHAQNAEKAFRKKYNWNIIKDSFINFVKNTAN
ncbi:glycosyltransferase [Chryseobacterium sp.]|uniref:glycosyltransferase n=1 Tax=Chryseobacterium sp. TaxID=1871047 RepID=UPI00289AAF0E|nr:glycosyltransferase [Chryseobacterium sp.]